VNKHISANQVRPLDVSAPTQLVANVQESHNKQETIPIRGMLFSSMVFFPYMLFFIILNVMKLEPHDKVVFARLFGSFISVL
jgi:hypothetical protein